MKVFWKRFFLFAFFAAVLYLGCFGILFGLRFGPVPLIYRTTQGNVFEGGLSYVKFRDFNKNDKYDVIVLGSSHAYRGYDPAIFDAYGYKMYNLGSSSQSILTSYVVAKHYINRNNCRTVIIDLYDRIFMLRSIESLSDLVQNVSSDKAAAEICLRANDIRALNMYTLRLFCKFTEPLNVDTNDIDRGFQAIKGQLTLPGKPKDHDYETNNQSLRHFAKLIRYLKSEGINVILTEHPLPQVYTIHPERHEQFKRDITSATGKYDVPFYDYIYDSTMTGIQYFSDENHLSLRGVEKFNHKLLRDLIADDRLARFSDRQETASGQLQVREQFRNK